MIDTKELREAIQTFGSQAINEGDMNELLDRLEAAEKEAAHIKEVEFPRKVLAVADGWKEAAISWEVCASIHREYARGKDPFFSTRQGDFVKHAQDARNMFASAHKEE